MSIFSTSAEKTVAALMRGCSTTYASNALSSLKKGILPEFPSIGDDSHEFACDYFAYNLLRKTRDPMFGFVPPSDEQLLSEAITGFKEVEALCGLVNRGYHPGWVTFDGNTIAPETVMWTVQRKISALLGEFSYDEFAESIDFSNGASTRLPRKSSAIPYKFMDTPHVTKSCELLAVCLIWHHEPWRRYCQDRFGRESDPFSWVKVVGGSEYFTVPKTALKLRGACKEPELNMLCQKGIGSMLRRRLRKVGINLNDQSLNRELALIGSRTGSLATLDLRNASDSVSLRLLDYLPDSWADAIRMTRSQRTTFDGGETWWELEKVSSMGNGFTFELESLIFWAIVASCCELSGSKDRRIGVYGDDIICHHSYAPLVVEVLSWLGFETNPEKSFISGPFRESCGGHYHYGQDVTPVYLRDNLTLVEDKYHFLNSVHVWMKRHLDDAQLSAYMLRTLLPKELRVAVPPAAGSRAGLWVPSIAHASSVYFCLTRQAYAFTALVGSARTRRMQRAPGYLTWLLGAIHDRLGEVLVPQGSEESAYRVLFSSEWGDCEVTFAGTGQFS